MEIWEWKEVPKTDKNLQVPWCKKEKIVSTKGAKRKKL